MIKLYYDNSTYEFLYSVTGGESWTQGDDDAKSLYLYFGSDLAGTFTNALTNVTIYNKSCTVNITRPGETTPAALAATAIISGTAGYYVLQVDSWVCEIAGDIEIDVHLKTASTTTAFDQTTLEIGEGSSGVASTITTAQYNTLIANYNTLNDIKLNKVLRGHYKTSELSLMAGSPSTTQEFIVQAYGSLLLDHTLDGAATVINDSETISDLPSGTDKVQVVIATREDDGSEVMVAYITARSSNATAKIHYGFAHSDGVTTTFTGWHQYANDDDLALKANLSGGNDFAGVQNFLNGVFFSVGVDIQGSLNVEGGIDSGYQKIANVDTGTLAGDAVNKGQMDTQLALKLALAGGTMSGAIAMGTNKITGLADGASAADAVNKSQLDLKENLTNKKTTLTDDTAAYYPNVAAVNTGLALKEDAANKGATNGYAPLVSGVIPAAYIPNAYDDFLVYATYALLEAETELNTAVLYIVTADETSGNNTSTYRWSGASFIKIHDQLSASEVKTLYESNANTNAYTDTEKSHLANLPADAYSQTALNDGQLDTRYYTETETADGTIPIVKTSTHVDTPKVILATGVYIEYNATDDSIDFVIE